MYLIGLNFFQEIVSANQMHEFLKLKKNFDVVRVLVKSCSRPIRSRLFKKITRDTRVLVKYLYQPIKSKHYTWS